MQEESMAGVVTGSNHCYLADDSSHTFLLKHS